MKSPALLAVIAAIAALGCRAPGEEEAVEAGGQSALNLAKDDFANQLREVARQNAKCETEGRCKRRGDLTVKTLGPRGGAPRIAAGEKKDVTDFTLCDAVGPFASLESPYFFVGGSVKAAAVATIADGGADVVFDLRNKQAAVFHYHQEGLQNIVGADAEVYVGYAFGRKANVIDAWSGEFQAASATVETPLLKVSVGGAIFRSPDNSIWGGLVEASLGFNLIPTVAEVAVSDGEWTAWDEGTVALGEGFYAVDYAEERVTAHGSARKYIQFENAGDLALAVVETLGLAGSVPAAHALALEALRKQGLTIENACPREDAEH